MEVIKKDGKYYFIQDAPDGFDIDREIGVLEDEIREREIQVKKLIRERDKK